MSDKVMFYQAVLIGHTPDGEEVARVVLGGSATYLGAEMIIEACTNSSVITNITGAIKFIHPKAIFSTQRVSYDPKALKISKG